MNRKVSIIKMLFRDKGFYAVLTLSFAVVLFASYLALGWNEEESEQAENLPENQNETVYYAPLPDGYVPDWEEETKTVDVSTEENVTVIIESEEPTEETAVEPEIVEPVVLYKPVDSSNVVKINEYSGSMPVFSETLGDWRVHQGVDFITDEPCDVYAAADGTVEDIYEDGFMGTSVLLRHNDGTYTLYQSLSPNIKVIKGSEVQSGDLLGKTSYSAENESLLGVHVHFEHIKDGKRVEPAFAD